MTSLRAVRRNISNISSTRISISNSSYKSLYSYSNNEDTYAQIAYEFMLYSASIVCIILSHILDRILDDYERKLKKQYKKKNKKTRKKKKHYKKKILPRLPLPKYDDSMCVRLYEHNTFSS